MNSRTYKALPRSVVASVRECIVERRCGDDTAHDTLIVPEEEEAACGHDGDGKLQSPTRHAHVLRDAGVIVLVNRAENHLDGTLPPGQ